MRDLPATIASRSVRQDFAIGASTERRSDSGLRALGGNESYPGVFQPIGGFADDAVVEDGFIRLDDAPGIGIERKAELNRLFREMLD